MEREREGGRIGRKGGEGGRKEREEGKGGREEREEGRGRRRREEREESGQGGIQVAYFASEVNFRISTCVWVYALYIYIV